MFLKKFLLFILCGSLAMVVCAPSSIYAQHSLQLDDGAGHVSLIHGQTANPLDQFTLPAGGGVLLANDGSGISDAWLLGGNIVTSVKSFGSKAGSPHDVIFVTNGVEQMRIFNIGGVSITGGLTINGFAPATLGVLHSSGGVVTNSLIVNADITPSTIALDKIDPTGAVGNQVIGYDLANVVWTQNGATITNSVEDVTMAANTNDFTLTPAKTYFRFSNTGGATLNLTGLSSTGVVNGRIITITNLTAFDIVLKHQDGGSLAANRFDLPGASDVIIAIRGAASFIYDTAEGLWKLYSTN